MASISTIVDQQNASVIITTDFSSVPAATALGATVNISRTIVGDGSVALRNTPAQLAGGIAVFGDTEMPINVPFFYIATSPQATGISLTSNTITITGSGGVIDGFLKDPITPYYDVPLTSILPLRSSCDTATGTGFISLEAESLANASGIFSIVNGARSRIISQLRKDATGLLNLETQQLTDLTNLDALLMSGRGLMLEFNPNSKFGWGLSNYGRDYIAVGDVTVARPDSADMRRTQRLWQLPYTLINAPPNTSTGLYGGNDIGVKGATWFDLKNSGSLWSSISGTKILDAFNRTVASGFGSADTGQAYTSSGGLASEHSVSPATTQAYGFGNQTSGTTNVYRSDVLTSVAWTDVEVNVTLRITSLPVSGSADGEVLLRWQSATNYYGFQFNFGTFGASTISIYKNVAGTPTTIQTNGAGFTYQANSLIRLRIINQSNALMMKAWLIGESQPQSWTLNATDSAFAGSGALGLQSRVRSGAAIPRSIQWQTLNATNLATDRTWLDIAQGIGY